MTDDAPLTAKQFGPALKKFLEESVENLPRPERPLPFFFARLGEHFGDDPRALPVVQEEFDLSDHPNLELAMQGYLGAEGRAHELFGFVEHMHPMGSNLSSFAVQPPEPASVQYVNITLADDDVLTCVKQGLYFVSEGDDRLVALLQASDRFGPRTMRLQVMARERDEALRFISDIRTGMRRRNVYRGHVLTFSPGMGPGGGLLNFHKLPKISREQIILPDGVLERIERHTIGFSRHVERLRASGRHIKRGILLHGPPGVGKTFSAMYLAAQMRERTILLLTGNSLGMVGRACHLARMLQPSIVVLEDVDLVAQERTHYESNTVLFELLNGMDGLAEDVDAIFLLTTNRPDLLEPALASRPGRIDQAIELPMPDASCRRRLIDLYGEGLDLRLGDVDRVVQRTEGVSAAFIRELMRKAALFAADEGADTVEDAHLDDALHELLVEGGELTKKLLGARPDVSM